MKEALSYKWISLYIYLLFHPVYPSLSIVVLDIHLIVNVGDRNNFVVWFVIRINAYTEYAPRSSDENKRILKENILNLHTLHSIPQVCHDRLLEFAIGISQKKNTQIQAIFAIFLFT